MSERDLLEAIFQRLEHMNQAEQNAFAALNTKADTLLTAVKALTTEISTEQQALKDALAADDTAGVLAAAAALSDKLDAAQTAATAALAPPADPVAPATPAA